MKESEIRPKKIFDKFLELAKKDTIAYFSKSDRLKIKCPACDSRGKYSFSKDNFDYCSCPECETLYVNPRPVSEAFSNYYTNSHSSKYWATTFYKKTANARRKKIWKPKAKMIFDILENEGKNDMMIIDVGGGYGIFAEEMQKLSGYQTMIIEPGPHLAEVCRKKGFHVIQKFLEKVSRDDLPKAQKCFVSFELFEHLHSPRVFLEKLYSLMNPNDLFIFTTLSGRGLDIQLLWESSPSVSPPHHLNFFNPNSVKVLLKEIGFKNILVTTPGKLDIDILSNNKDHIKDKFWKSFINTSNEEQKKIFQSAITESGWSSHMMVIAKRV